MGRSGAVGDDVERIYMMLLVPEMRQKLAQQLGHAMAQAWIPHLPGGGLLLGSFAAALLGHVSGLEKIVDHGPLSAEASAGLKAYVEGPLRNQFGADRKMIPAQSTIIFGHTHKPFAQAVNFVGYPGRTAVFNTGGWVVDTEAVAEAHGASMVVVDAAWNVAALHIYNEGDYSVRVQTPEMEPSANPLLAQLNDYLSRHLEPWAALSAAIAASVESYHQDFGKHLKAIKPEADSKTRAVPTV